MRLSFIYIKLLRGQEAGNALEFRWNDWNIEHIGEHGVEPDG